MSVVSLGNGERNPRQIRWVAGAWHNKSTIVPEFAGLLGFRVVGKGGRDNFHRILGNFRQGVL